MDELREVPIIARGKRYSVSRNGREIARVRMIFVENDLHEKPYALIEDLHVSEECRGQGVGTSLVQRLIEDAKKSGCTKIIATSRLSRENIHSFYENNDLKRYGFEFRKDLK